MKISEEAEEWLRAALEGKALEYRRKDTGKWFVATDFFEDVIKLTHPDFEVRIKPDVIIVNGIEVPAPEKGELVEGAIYWMADASEVNGRSMGIYWHGGDTDKRWLRYGIVHTSADAAEAHGKAMRAHKPG